MAGAVADNNQSDFQCQVGDSNLVIPKEASDANLELGTCLPELTPSKDVQCQAYMMTPDIQGQAKNFPKELDSLKTRTTSDVHCQAQNKTLNVHTQAEMDTSASPTVNQDAPTHGNKPLTHSKSTETNPQAKTTSSASQCDLLTSISSLDVQCQAGNTEHPVKVSASADFQCQAGASQSDFQCQFNDNVNA